MNTATSATKGYEVPVLMKANTAYFIRKTQHSSGDTWLHFKFTLRNIEPERRRGRNMICCCWGEGGSEKQDCYHLSSKGMNFVTFILLSFSLVHNFQLVTNVYCTWTNRAELDSDSSVTDGKISINFKCIY